MEVRGKPESRRSRARLLDWINARYEPDAPPPADRPPVLGAAGQRVRRGPADPARVVAGLVGARGDADRARGRRDPLAVRLDLRGFRQPADGPVRRVRGLRQPGRRVVRRHQAGQGRRALLAGRDREHRADHRHGRQRDPVAGGPGHDPGDVRRLLRGGGRAQRRLRRDRRAVPLRPAGGHGRDHKHDPGSAGGLVAGLGRVHGGGAGVLAAIAGRPAERGGGRLGPGADHQACLAAKHELMNAFASTPYRPTGLATSDQAMASVVQYLEWCTALVADATDGHPNLDRADPPDRELFAETAVVLRQTAELLADRDRTAPLPDLDELERRREASIAYRQSPGPDGDYDSVQAAARQAFHAQAISLAVRGLAADALIATRRADPETIAARRRGWYGAQPEGTDAERRVAALYGALGVLTRHASIRSVWFLNSLRASVALAAAVLVADVSGVQHGFWVVLGTLSVLRTNASTTESTALRALGGTVIGFVIGALLLLGIGTSTPALWTALPIAIAVAAYAPGTLPFTFGQAAFTVVVVVLFNLLVPAGWKVGLLRIEDVAIGCAVSLVVGVLFWPRGAASVVGDDLADAFRVGAAYLTESVQWALGTRQVAPDAGPAAVTAGIRLDEALRGFLAEQGAKHLPKSDLWMLVMATMRLRLTAYSLAGLKGPMPLPPHRNPSIAYAKTRLTEATAELAAFYERVAVLVGRPAAREVVLPVSAPAFTGLTGTIPVAGVSPQDVAAMAEVGAALGAAAPGEASGADGVGGTGGTGGAGGAGGADLVRV